MSRRGEFPSRRREFLLAAGGLLVASVAHAQSAGTVYRIGYLGLGRSVTSPRRQAQFDAFRQGMHTAGWIEGQHYVMDMRFDEGRPERYPALAKELVGRGPHVLLGLQTPAIRALMQATKTVPIVMIGPDDPVRDGFIASHARPGSNVTGLTFNVDLGIYVKQVELLKEILPNLSSIAVLYNPSARFPVTDALVTHLASLRLRTIRAEARSAEDIEPAFVRMKREGAQAALLIVDGLLAINTPRVVELALTYRLPLVSMYQGTPLDGGLMSYAPDLTENFRRAAAYVDRILRGANPADLPVERPTTIKLIVNKRTAQALGLEIPTSILLRADQVIE